MFPATGLHGLFRLDGGTVDATDAAILELSASPPSVSGVAQAVDPVSPQAVHRSDARGQLTLLAGDLEETEELAARLQLCAKAPHADLARAALRRFGVDTPIEMLGEWVLLHWDADERRLTLMASGARRSRLFYSVSGMRCAVSPDLFQLSRLPWVGRELDEAGLLYQVGRVNLRERAGASTMLQKVRQLLPAQTVVISADGVQCAQANVLTPQPRWRGTFEEACEEAEALLARILRTRLRRTGAAALMLSGGLDSSLLASIAAGELSSGQRLHLLTSVAPPGSGLPDERYFAELVAATLGLECTPVYPPAEANAYRPPDDFMRAVSGPPLTNRHPLARSFEAAARAAGASFTIDGGYGELHVTGYSPVPTLRDRAASLRRWTRRAFARPAAAGAVNSFHVRLSPDRMAGLPDEIAAGLAAPPPSSDQREPRDLWGYSPGAPRALDQRGEYFPGGTRFDYPYRDIRLLRLFAGMPLSYFRRNGFQRAPVRHILKGRLPDAIRLRRRGMPASPDHMVRLQHQAPAARERLPVFRRAEIDDWLDLDWLDNMLAQVAERGPADVDEANQVQLTAMNAEFLTWWRSGN